jgi:hypothetical protein
MSDALPSNVRPDPEVVDTELDNDEVALLHLRTKTYFSLNPTGARIWRDLKQGRSLEEVCRRLQAEFDVDANRATRSVDAFVSELLCNELAHRA